MKKIKSLKEVQNILEKMRKESKSVDIEHMHRIYDDMLLETLKILSKNTVYEKDVKSIIRKFKKTDLWYA